MADLNLQISDLRTRITLQQPTLVTDAGGAQKPAYADATATPTVWAQWINDHGQESVSGGAYTSAQRATVRLRHRNDILKTWRVLKDAEAWMILSIDSIRDQNRWIELRVERVTSTV